MAISPTCKKLKVVNQGSFHLLCKKISLKRLGDFLYVQLEICFVMECFSRSNDLLLYLDSIFPNSKPKLNMVNSMNFEKPKLTKV